MIDTFMALWNRGSRHRGIRVFFTFTLVCISLSLFLVTIIIPGWMLYTQSDSGMVAVNADKAPPTPAQDADISSMPMVQTPMAISVTSTATSVPCITPTPTSGAPVLKARISKPAHRGGQIPSPAPTAVALGQNANARMQVESHAVYSGRPSGAVSHLQSSVREAHTPTPVATRSVSSNQANPDSASPSKKVTPSPQASVHNGAQARVEALLIPVQNYDARDSKADPTPVVTHHHAPLQARAVRQSAQVIMSDCG